jgi:hypothetical protein
MWQQIKKVKDWCYTPIEHELTDLHADVNSEDIIFTRRPIEQSVVRALDHYCSVCDRGFTTAHGCKNHKRIKHKA